MFSFTYIYLAYILPPNIFLANIFLTNIFFTHIYLNEYSCKSTAISICFIWFYVLFICLQTSAITELYCPGDHAFARSIAQRTHKAAHFFLNFLLKFSRKNFIIKLQRVAFMRNSSCAEGCTFLFSEREV